MSGVIKDLFFPVACPICDKLGMKNQVETKGCCNKCMDEYIYPKETAVVNFPEFAPFLNQAVCCSDYSGLVREAMHQFKFNEATYKGKYFGRIIYGILRDSGCINNPDMITVVPISDKRFKDRGYNQSLLIAREISRLSGLPYVETMLRTDRGEAQSKMLIHDRIKSGQNRFIGKPDIELQGKALLLVDDILTSGNTLNQCAGVLKSMGASWITGVTFTGGRKDFG